MTGDDLSWGQQQALTQLREIADVSDALQVLNDGTGASANPFLPVRVSLDCANAPHHPSGLKLRGRERFLILIPRDFPFAIPTLMVPHRRWAGTPHVQWGVQLCLYAAPSVEWVPADGMFGFIKRLTVWLEKASLGELDPDDQLLHPPVAYVSAGDGFVVVHADIGSLAPAAMQPGRRPASAISPIDDLADGFRLVVGVSEGTAGGRIDVLEWVSVDEWLRRYLVHETPADVDGRFLVGTLAVLTDREMTFEYPKQAAALIDALEGVGVPRDDLFRAVGVVGAVNYELARSRAVDGSVQPADLHVFVGTPSRRSGDGVLRQHTRCWRLDRTGRLVAENLIWSGSGDDALARLGDMAQELLPQWIAQAEISWVRVMEDRPEVTTRRDAGSSMAAICGQRVLVLGCGALGAPIAEYCVRGGAAAVHVVDDDVVTPGVLVRQPYADGDIGTSKAEALAARLNLVRRDAPVTGALGRAEVLVLAEGAPPPPFDVIVDATADAAVCSLIELRRQQSAAPWPAVISVLIGHDARRGVVAIAKQGATGVGRQIFRRLALASRGQYADRLADVAEDFFPLSPRTATFQPEPGCSSPTFIGSAADLAALSGHLFDVACEALTDTDRSRELAEPMIVASVRLQHEGHAPLLSGVSVLGWPNDLVASDPDSGYQVRVSPQALAGMRTEARRGARLRGPKIETGGLLLGEIDHACRCIWIDDISGPPPDSLLSEVHFDHGIEGVEELISYHRDRTGNLSTFIGMWHSHPFGAAAPSPTDKAAMTTLVTPISGGPSRALVLIVGAPEQRWTEWLEGTARPDVYVRFVTRAGHGHDVVPPPVPKRHLSEAWPGGWRERPKTPARERRRRWSLRRRRIRL